MRRTASCLAVWILASAANAQQYFHGIEPNQDKAMASPALQMGAYDRLAVAGGLFGGSIVPPNVFRIQTEALPPEVYRYEMWGAYAPLSTVLGRTATVDLVDPQSTAPVLPSPSGGPATPFLTWYGFGKSEEVFIDFYAAGSGRMFSATTELIVSNVFERDLGAVPESDHVLRARIAPGSGAMGDLELFVFDAEFNAIPYGSNDESALSTEGPAVLFDVPPGLYHVAVCDHAAATHLPPDAADLRTSADVLDFAGALVCGSTAVDVPVEVLIEDPSGVIVAQGSATKLLPYEALWFRVQVGAGQSLESFCAGDGSAGTCGCLGLAPPRSGMGCKNSTGRGATLIATDHVSSGTGDWRVTLEDLPPMSLAIGFVGLQATTPAPLLGGSSCIAPGAARTVAVQADAAGTAVLSTLQPAALGFLVGQRVYVQCAYRDAVAPIGCQVNFTSGYSFLVR